MNRNKWIVLRYGFSAYAIDYIFVDSTPTLHDAHSIKSIQIDARPAIDDVQSLVDRVRFPFMKSFGWVETDVDRTQRDRVQEEEKATDILEAIGSMTKEDVAACGGMIQSKCKTCFEKVNTCSSEEACARESLALTLCMASVVCPEQAKNLQENPSLESAHDTVAACLQQFEKRAYEVSG